jgi:hypothetical protein
MGRHHTVVAAYVALFTALGGSAYAANVVTSEDIADETIQAEDIAPGGVANEELADESVTPHKLRYSSVDGSKVINASLSGVDVANGGLTGYDLADASVKGEDLGLATVQSQSGSEAEMTKTVTASCPAGKKAVGGGAAIRPSDWNSNPANKISLVESTPTESGNGWTARAEVIRHPATLDFTLKKDEDGYVTGVSSYIKADHLTYHGPWRLDVRAICV